MNTIIIRSKVRRIVAATTVVAGTICASSASASASASRSEICVAIDTEPMCEVQRPSLHGSDRARPTNHPTIAVATAAPSQVGNVAGDPFGCARRTRHDITPCAI